MHSNVLLPFSFFFSVSSTDLHGNSTYRRKIVIPHKRHISFILEHVVLYLLSYRLKKMFKNKDYPLSLHFNQLLRSSVQKWLILIISDRICDKSLVTFIFYITFNRLFNFRFVRNSWENLSIRSILQNSFRFIVMGNSCYCSYYPNKYYRNTLNITIIIVRWTYYEFYWYLLRISLIGYLIFSNNKTYPILMKIAWNCNNVNDS